jgi:acyl-CoA reductase-like NAD-dependent aldehyde dehydrogenase
MEFLSNLIDGHAVSATASYHVIHPVNGAVLKVQRSTLADLDAAIAVTHGARRSWRRTPLAERSACILRAADLLADPRTGWADKMRDANRLETAISDWWSQVQVLFVPDSMRYLVSTAEEALARTQTSHGSSELRHTTLRPRQLTRSATVTIAREPYGVCLAMPPWNAVRSPCH